MCKVFCMLSALLLTGMPLSATEWPESPKPASALGPEVWVGVPIEGDSPCEALADRVCGKDRACSGDTVCEEVLGLLEKEREEQRQADTPGRMTYASGQCQDADGNRDRYRTCSN